MKIRLIIALCLMPCASALAQAGSGSKSSYKASSFYLIEDFHGAGYFFGQAYKETGDTRDLYWSARSYEKARMTKQAVDAYKQLVSETGAVNPKALAHARVFLAQHDKAEKQFPEPLASLCQPRPSHATWLKMTTPFALRMLPRPTLVTGGSLSLTEFSCLGSLRQHSW